jgi:hypothetical protein
LIGQGKIVDPKTWWIHNGNQAELNQWTENIMVRQKAVLFLCALSAILLFGSQNSFACVCGPRVTVLDAFERSDLVVTTTVVSVAKADEGSRIATTLVRKVYKGNIRGDDELVFDQGVVTDCTLTFDEQSIGHEYLLYLGKPLANQRYIAGSFCGRSGNVESADDDLLYLDNMDKVQGKTRISGTLGHWTGENPSFAGRKIRILKEDKVWEITTDKNGIYEIYDLPAGQYLIEPEIPKGWKINSFQIQRYAASFSGNRNQDSQARMKSIPIILQENRHAGLDIIFDPDNTIRGRVLSPAGQPMESVCLDAIRTDNKPGILMDCTDLNGEYEIDELPSGNYLLAANKFGEITGNQPFETLYYPGVFDKDNAAVLSIGTGTSLDGLDLRVPRMSERIEVLGNILYSDGKPATNHTVLLEFKPDATTGGAKGAATSKNINSGAFHLYLLKGFEGTLSATIMTYKGKFRNCPMLDKLIDQASNRLPRIPSNEVRISGMENISDIQLSFPFPYCEK